MALFLVAFRSEIFLMKILEIKLIMPIFSYWLKLGFFFYQKINFRSQIKKKKITAKMIKMN